MTPISFRKAMSLSHPRVIDMILVKLAVVHCVVLYSTCSLHCKDPVFEYLLPLPVFYMSSGPLITIFYWIIFVIVMLAAIRFLCLSTVSTELKKLKKKEASSETLHLHFYYLPRSMAKYKKNNGFS